LTENIKRAIKGYSFIILLPVFNSKYHRQAAMIHIFLCLILFGDYDHDNFHILLYLKKKSVFYWKMGYKYDSPSWMHEQF
jgi:hypothetical protein